jgi:hypothetical protein
MQEVTPLSGTSLLDFVAIKKKEEELERIAYSKVMTWMCPKNVDLFEGEKFPSQWGNIRRIALQNKTKEEIKAALFTGEHAFLTRGVAKDKWQEKGRLSKLQEFINDDDLTDENIQQALINLASEMAKKK